MHSNDSIHNHKFLWTANEKILLSETETSSITSFSTHEEFDDNFDEINTSILFFTPEYSYIFILIYFIKNFS